MPKMSNVSYRPFPMSGVVAISAISVAVSIVFASGGFSSAQTAGGAAWASLTVNSASQTTLESLSSANATKPVTLFAFFLPLSHDPVAIDVTHLHSVGEVARSVVAELALTAKLGRAVTAADVRLLPISHAEAFRIIASATYSVPTAEKGAPLRTLDAFDATRLEKGSCLLVELKVDSPVLSDKVPALNGISPPPSLPTNACETSPRFAYLITIAGDMFPTHGDFADLLADPDVASFYVTWRVPLRDYPFHPGTFGENRNFLLELAVASEQRRGCRFLYYVFVDEHTPRLKLNDMAQIDGIRTDIAPYVAFREMLLEWRPAVGYPRYEFMPKFDPQRRTPAHSVVNFDHVMVAVHFTAARLLLPYAIDLETLHWWHAQLLIDLVASMLYLESSLEFRSFESFPKVDHESSSKANNPGRTFDFAVMESYLRNAVLSEDKSVLAKRVFPGLAVLHDGLERRGNVSQRYDIDVRVLGIKKDHAVWTRANSFWARLGAANSQCVAGFCDLVDPVTSGYVAQLTDCRKRPCIASYLY